MTDKIIKIPVKHFRHSFLYWNFHIRLYECEFITISSHITSQNIHKNQFVQVRNLLSLRWTLTIQYIYRYEIEMGMDKECSIVVDEEWMRRKGKSFNNFAAVVVVLVLVIMIMFLLFWMANAVGWLVWLCLIFFSRHS